MVKLSKESKQRLQQVFQCGQFILRWGFIPTVLYLGFKRGADPGMPEPTVLRDTFWAVGGFCNTVVGLDFHDWD
uniref:Mitochondrial import receptor subunit TOM7 homolog n=1 Tax=Cyprinus carpio carpio TaxID=630221 RepID=A0A8C1C722_CYPCA